MNEDLVIQTAGFWRRSFTFLLDLTIVNLIYFSFLLIGKLALQVGLTRADMDRPSEDLILSLVSPLFLLWLILFLIYFSLFAYFGGQTPAKMLSGIQVRSITLTTLTWKQAILRVIGYSFSSFFFGAGFLFMLFNRDRRALHDFIAGTRVIRL
jgi:uncharacterized RDD family membrane protein YckC